MATFWYVPIGLDRLLLCLKFQALNPSQALSRDVFGVIFGPKLAQNGLLGPPDR